MVLANCGIILRRNEGETFAIRHRKLQGKFFVADDADFHLERYYAYNITICYDNMKTDVCFRFRFKVLKLFKAPQVLLDLGCLPYIRLMHQL